MRVRVGGQVEGKGWVAFGSKRVTLLFNARECVKTKKTKYK